MAIQADVLSGISGFAQQFILVSKVKKNNRNKATVILSRKYFLVPHWAGGKKYFLIQVDGIDPASPGLVVKRAFNEAITICVLC